MARAAVARIDLNAVRHNYRHAKRLGRGTPAVAVVKADAYGHGAVPVAQALAGVADAFGVASIEEALRLREAGIREPILLLEGVFEAAELALVDAHRLWITVHNREQLAWLRAVSPSRPLNVWLKLDSGMHRLGFDAAELRRAYAVLADCRHVAEIVLMTHFARADEGDGDYTRAQLAYFERATAGLAGPRSLANSPTVLAWPEAHGD